ncbi:XRE family transcriptional regulator [Streptomyces sp. NPDC006476]|uniref:helix-turn-helix domain-containing protein n=1 Tax=Streptomyces sp. NPDC006476 TaxID=3157175 RepID=UPI0033A3A8DC
MTDIMGSVAANIRRIRTVRGLSLNELSRQSSVAKATLAQLELGRGNPTLETLMSLATHLGVPLTDLIASESVPLMHVTRANEGMIVRGDGLDLRLIHRMTNEKTMYEIYDMRMSQGTYESPPHSMGVLEHLIVHQGSLLVGPQSGSTKLDVGDFIAFSADRPHLYECLTPEAEATLIVLYPMGAADR